MPEEEKVQTPQTPPPTSAPKGGDVEENKAMAILAYIWILVLIPLLAKKDSPFAQYHAKQGLVLLIAWVIVSVIWVIPVIGWVLAPLGNLLCFILMIIGIVNAANGQEKQLPLIGQFGAQFKF